MFTYLTSLEKSDLFYVICLIICIFYLLCVSIVVYSEGPVFVFAFQTQFISVAIGLLSVSPLLNASISSD